MKKIIVYPTELAQWQAIVQEAEHQVCYPLNEELQSYLVFLLMRFNAQPDMISRVLAIEFLSATKVNGEAKIEQFRQIGDQCLLLSGLFPERAHSVNVESNYFVDIGQSAYSELSLIEANKFSDLFSELATEFIHLADILQALSPMKNQEPDLKNKHLFLFNESKKHLH